MFEGCRKTTPSFRGTQEKRAKRTIDKLEVNEHISIPMQEWEKETMKVI
jgi:hypothetical protein